MSRDEPDWLRKIALSALVVAVAAMPFSIWVCHWSYLLFIFCWLFEGKWRQRWEASTGSWQAFLLPLFFILHVAGMFYTGNTASGWQHIDKKGAFVLIPITLATTHRLGKADLHLLLKTFVVACVVATVICFGNAIWSVVMQAPHHNFDTTTTNELVKNNPGVSMNWMYFSYISLASGVGLHPTYFGLYLNFCLLILIYLTSNDTTVMRHQRVVAMVFVYLVVFVIFLSSRINIIVTAGICLWSVMALGRHDNKRKILFIAGASLVLFAIMYVNPVSRFRGLQEPPDASLATTGQATSSIDIRISLLKLSQVAATNVNPWTGVGTGAGQDLMRAQAAEHGLTANVLGSFDPHNQFVYTFLELGVPGLLMLCICFAATGYTAIKKKSSMLTGLVCAFVAVCLTESALELQKGIILFTFFSSLLMFHEQPARAD